MKSLRSPVDLALREVIRKARKAAGLTQIQLARRLRCRQSLISTIETGERARIDVPEFVEIARAIGVDPGELLDEAIRMVQHPTIDGRPRRAAPGRKAPKKVSRG